MLDKTTAPLVLYSRTPPHDIASEQLLLVTARGTAATLYCYEKTAPFRWRLSVSRAISAHIGKSGVRSDKTEGDGSTPAGLYSLGPAFGVRNKPETKMPYRVVTQNSYWIDDPESLLYNTWAEGIDDTDWSSAERLSDYPSAYAYAVVIGYNTEERVPGKGSAVFLHCGEAPTSGCVAVSEIDMLQLLQWLDPEKSPKILIVVG